MRFIGNAQQFSRGCLLTYLYWAKLALSLERRNRNHMAKQVDDSKTWEEAPDLAADHGFDLLEAPARRAVCS